MRTAWTKDYLVVMFSDYDGTWREVTVPCTFMQAIRFVRAKHWNDAMKRGNVMIVTKTEFAEMPKSKETA
jgi:hypothetical protein